jgi:hypothetical protein
MIDKRKSNGGFIYLGLPYLHPVMEKQYVYGGSAKSHVRFTSAAERYTIWPYKFAEICTLTLVKPEMSAKSHHLQNVT